MNTRMVATAAFAFAMGCKTDVNVQNQANQEPTVAIMSPADGTVFAETDAIDFVGSVGDGNGIEDIVSVVWTSDIDSELETTVPDAQGTVRMSTTLSAGSHAIELTATDREGARATASLTVHVQGEAQAPSALILQPSDNGLYLSDAPLQLVGQVSDLQQTSETLQAVWYYTPANGGARELIAISSVDPSGEALAEWTTPIPSAWLIELEVTDEDGNSQVDSVAVTVMHPDEADMDGDNYPGSDDCDDFDFDVNPGRNEVCNGVDDDCSGVIDDKDLDEDDHIDESCSLYVGPLPVDDCNDTNAFIFTGAFEQPDNADNDCNGQIDEGTDLFDDDGDCECESLSLCNGSSNIACLTLGYDDCDDSDPSLNNEDGDGDGGSTCSGDCDDTDNALNVADFDNDLLTTCDGDCSDFDGIPTFCP